MRHNGKSNLTAAQKRKLRLKMMAAGAGGAAVGAAVGHTAAQAVRRSRSGRALRRLPGHQRAEFIAPVATAAGVAAYAANYQRKKAKRRYMDEQEIAGAVKTSSFDPTQWVIDSLMR